MTKKRYIITIVILVAVFAAGLILFARTTFLIRSAGIVSRHLLGYEMAAGSFVLSTDMRADIRDLSLIDARRENLLFTISRLSVESSPGKAVKGEVERITLKGPKIRIRLGDRKQTETDLSFIKRIPPVYLLTMENGEIYLHFKGSEGNITLKGINITVKEFSPEGGGALVFNGSIAIDQPGGSKISARGKCKGQLNLTGIFPDLLGKGMIEVDIEKGSWSDIDLKGARFTVPVLFEKGRIVISKAAAAIGMIEFLRNGKGAQLKNGHASVTALFDTGSKKLATSGLNINAPGIGVVKGAATITLKGSMPWSARLEAREINFSNLFSMARTMLPDEEARKWSIQGTGSLNARMEGTMSGKAPSLSGQANMEFKKGGFSSPDGSKAAQGIDGSVILNFTFPRGDRDASMKISSVISSGEYLWGKYYKNLAKEPSKLSSKADVTVDGGNVSQFRGTCDLFNTGRYAYSGFAGTGKWGFHLIAQDVAVKRLVSLFLADYLAGMSVSLKDIEADGKIDTDISLTSAENDLAARGNIKMKGASLKLPSMSLGVKSIDMDVPFDLASGKTIDKGAQPDVQELGQEGMIVVTGFTKGEYSLPEMKIPVFARGSDISVTGVMTVPFYGGTIRIRNLKAQGIFGASPKISFAASVTGIDVPGLLNEVTGFSFPATMKARFPMIAYENGELRTEGKTAIDIFGGRIEAVDIYAKNPFAPSRKIGGDILFRDIDLGKATETIKIGKVTGVVEGSLKGLVIEYGQPSRFVFELDTVKKSGVSQKVSIDAIENISILGTGSGGIGMVLKSGLNRFFKEYPYSRIGILCTLENDNFKIRGKIVEGSKEYLIRRAFLRGIDVVNMDPDNTVSFRDMQERVSRVFQKNEDGAGPTIKMN